MLLKDLLTYLLTSISSSIFSCCSVTYTARVTVIFVFLPINCGSKRVSISVDLRCGHRSLLGPWQPPGYFSGFGTWDVPLGFPSLTFPPFPSTFPSLPYPLPPSPFPSLEEGFSAVSILLDPVVICTCFVLIHLMEADALNSKLVSYGILFQKN